MSGTLAHVRPAGRGMAPIAAGLLRGWRGTVFMADGAEARLGRRAPLMDALLRRLGVRMATIFGAWNPLSRRFPGGWNARMHARLMRRLGRARPPAIAAEGRPARGPWPPEVHVLLPGDPRPALRLARLFRQHAVLVLRLRAPCRLLVLR